MDCHPKINNYNINLINNLTKYMLNEEVINNSLSYLVNNLNDSNNVKNVNNESIQKEKEKEFKKIKSPFFIPRQKDSLFWCFYILKNSIEKYENMDFINIVVEKNLKIEYIEKFRKKKELLKMYKLSSLSHIENVLLNELKIDVKTFISLCVLENINILFIHKKTFFELKMNSDQAIQIIHFFPDKYKYGIEIENDSFIFTTKIEEYKEKYYKITNIEKPIKAISAYKSEELVEISLKLGLETINSVTGKTFLKKELYEEIIKILN